MDHCWIACCFGWLDHSAIQTLMDVYTKALRTSFFAGFLTLGGFLFSVQMFITSKLKENVYDSKKYRERIEILRKTKPDLEFYGPLKRFNHMLLFGVLLSLSTSLLQITLGLIETPITVVICYLAAIVTIVVVLLCLWGLKGNLKDWFQWIEEEANEKPGEDDS